MSQEPSDLRRVVSSTGVYAAAAVAQKGVAFFLLPIYTRYIDPAQYGVLELLTALSAVFLTCLMVGLPSAINKCYHRDCDTEADQRSLLVTAILLDLPILLAGGAVLVSLAGPISRWVVGGTEAKELMYLVVANALLASLSGLVLASLRARERALAFSLLTLTQFLGAMLFNIALVVHFGLGIQGVLWGNLASNALALPLALATALRGSLFTFNRRLVRPLLRFGVLLVPAMLAGWVIDLSDRYLLRLYRDLAEVAVYGVGYKIGMIIQLAIVWPFQLAWPAVSFSISHRRGHRKAFARTLTYLTLALVFSFLGLSLLARVVIPALVGSGYTDAYRVVPLVTLAYAFNGVFYCVAPGVHLSENTKFVPLFAWGAAVLNLVLNLLLLPRFGMMGAALSTAVAFAGMSLAMGTLGQRAYPVAYEYPRLFKIVFAGGLVYMVGVILEPESFALSLAWQLTLVLLAFPALLTAMGVLEDSERAAIRRTLHHYVPRLRP